jgi:hypothetical protein
VVGQGVGPAIAQLVVRRIQLPTQYTNTTAHGMSTRTAGPGHVLGVWQYKHDRP